MMPVKRVHRWKSDTDPVEECRSLREILCKKTEILYWECRFAENKTGHIRAMVSTFAGLSVLVTRLDLEPGNKLTPDIFTDARGYTYRAEVLRSRPHM